MIAVWMLHLSAVSLLLGLAAWALERGFALRGWPLRGVWVGALAGSVALPVAVTLLSRGGLVPAPEASVLIGAAQIAEAPAPEGAAAKVGIASWLRSLDLPLLIGWGAASALLLLFLAISALRLWQRRRAWQRVTLGQSEILLSRDTGPAVVGLLRGAVVLPEWVLELDPARQALLLAHEEEHLRAGDPRLLLLVIPLLIVMPWNLPLWWQAYRLRLATELDCDARVLDRIPGVRAYGSLLLEVGARVSGRSLLMASFSEPVSFLERRLHMMTRRGPRRSAPALLLAVGIASAVGVVACNLDQPHLPTSLGPDVLPEQARELSAVAQEPTFTPYTARPELLNRAELGQLLADAYPPVLREAGIGGTSVLWVFIDETGQVRNTRLERSSGEARLDGAAQAVMRRVRFRPAEHRGEAVPVWIQLPVTFQAGGVPARPQAAREAREGEQSSATHPSLGRESRASGSAQASAGPRFTPYDGRPELQNRGDFARVLEETYPTALKAAGIGGTAVLWLHIDTHGRVTETEVVETSGQPALDRAAQEALRHAEFSPATLRGTPTAVWIQVPITFRTR